MPSSIQVPNTSLLGVYKRKDAYTDCYSKSVSIPVTLPQFIEAFYTTRLFKLERWIFAMILKVPSPKEQVLQLARSNSVAFSVWQVESRTNTEILLAAWQTRSWLCVQPSEGEATLSTTLYFGSAVISSKPNGKFNLMFHMLGGFHRLYSKLLLSAAAKKAVINYRKEEK